MTSMTREEAIEQLKWYFEYDNGLSADKETVEAYKMAIKALEQEPADWHGKYSDDEQAYKAFAKEYINRSKAESEDK